MSNSSPDQAANATASDTSRPSIFFGWQLAPRQKMTVRLLAGLAVVAIGFAGWWLGQSYAAAPVGETTTSASAEDSANRPMPVSVIRAEAVETYDRLQRYTGTIVAARQTDLAFERPGRVLELLVDEGNRVSKDQPLAKLDQRHLTAARRQAKAQLSEANAVLTELEAGPRKETIAAAEAQLRSIVAQREVATRNLDRRRRLVDSRAISEEEFEESLYDLREIEAQVDSSQKVLDELVAGTRKERIAAQQARVEQLRAALSDIDHDLQDTTLVAPFDGAIAKRNLDEGAIITAGTVVFEMIEIAHPELWVGVPSRVAGRLSAGSRVSAEIEGSNYAASVRSIRPQLDATTRTQNVVLDITSSKNPDTSLLPVPGQVARVMLPRTIQEPGFWVPVNALTPRKRGLWAVYVAEPGSNKKPTVAARDVELLHTDGDRAFVRGALQTGEAIIAAGSHRIVEGQEVLISSRVAEQQ